MHFFSCTPTFLRAKNKICVNLKKALPTNNKNPHLQNSALISHPKKTNPHQTFSTTHLNSHLTPLQALLFKIDAQT